MMKNYAERAEEQESRVERILNQVEERADEEHEVYLTDNEKVTIGRLIMEEDGIKGGIEELHQRLISPVEKINAQIKQLPDINPK